MNEYMIYKAYVQLNKASARHSAYINAFESSYGRLSTKGMPSGVRQALFNVQIGAFCSLTNLEGIKTLQKHRVLINFE